MSVQVKAVVYVVGPDDTEVDLILTDLVSHHQPERRVYVTVIEDSREAL